MDNFGDLIARTEQDLQDTDNEHWSDAELKGYLNEAQLEFSMEAKHPVIVEPVALEEDRFMYDTPAKLQEVLGAVYEGESLPIWTEGWVEQEKRRTGYNVTQGYPTPWGNLAISSSSDRRTSYETGDSWRYDTGTPRGLVMSERSATQFRAYPIPDVNCAPFISTISSGTDDLLGGGTSWTWTGDTDHYLPGLDWLFAVGEDSTNTSGYFDLIAWLDAHDYTDGHVQVTDDGDGFGFLHTISLDRQIGVIGVKRSAVMVNDSDIPDVTPNYFEALVHGAVYRAYLKDGPTQDRGKSDTHQAKFLGKAGEARLKEELGSANFYRNRQPTVTVRR